MDAIFSDPGIEREFRRKGYVVRPFLSRDQVAALLDLHESSTPNVPADYYATPFSRDPDYRRRVYEGIKGVMRDELERLLPHHRPCLGGFVTKRANTKQGKVALHQDYSFVDQETEVAVHIWCPLVDVDERNGCIKVVEGSHTFFKHISAIPTNPSPFVPLSDLLEREFTIRLPMAAGSAFIYDERLLHGSDDNLSDGVRIAGGCALVPEDVAPRLYCFNSERPDQLEILEVSEAFLGRFEPGGYVGEPYPEGVRRLGTIAYAAGAMHPDDLDGLRRLQAEIQKAA